MNRRNTVIPGLLCLMLLSVGVAKADEALYQVKDGYKVDANTLQGFRTWRQSA